MSCKENVVTVCPVPLQVIYCIVSLLLMHSLHHLWSTRMRQFLHWGWGCCHIRDSRNQCALSPWLARLAVISVASTSPRPSVGTLTPYLISAH